MKKISIWPLYFGEDWHSRNFFWQNQCRSHLQLLQRLVGKQLEIKLIDHF